MSRLVDPMLSIRHVSTSILALSFTSCVYTAPGQFASPAEADAFISESFAQFIFPVENSNEFRWHVATPTAYDGKPEYFWAAEWDIPEAREGKDPYGLDVAMRWRPSGAKSGTLADLIHAAEVTVHTECMTCGAPAFIPHNDRSVRADVIDGRVAITIRGRDAIARIFPTRPDSVFLSRSTLDASTEVRWSVAVRSSRRASANTR
jgi:hypothetical protein